jgi:hypothetical protein
MYKELLEYCVNEDEIRMIHALLTIKSQRKAAKELGMARSTLQDRVKKIRERVKIPSTHTNSLDEVVKSPFVIKGTSTLYDVASGEGSNASRSY